MTRLQRALANARIERRPYLDADMTRAEARLSYKIASSTWHGALSFDDQMKPVRDAAARTQEGHRREYSASQNAFLRHLTVLSETVVAQDIHQLQGFLAYRILEPEGALVLGCVLHLAAREDSARFWWQFAAGAGARGGACCLYLQHMGHGERDEAELWRAQAELGAPAPMLPDFVTREDLLTTLRILAFLREGKRHFTPAVTAVLAYVPDAVDEVDGLELPLPEPDFPDRIEELTARG
ncbi:hypothetical protein [Streptomyces spirodelae]|uniref:Uncharacterized protein n=1 Tax=Streptomyces spirodelae TaxID=2812904 RepID=A0ABS3X1E5_9ACTN|nr:hypothetical protein [Streptomyces spirodelae]MBO8189200.1 hypothetical protein [Streptomyces spirodelae]